MLVTLLGIEIEVSEEQPENAELPIVVTLSGFDILTIINFSIPLHNSAGIVSILSPKVKEVI